MSRASRRTWALIAGGGTAGHVLPGLAVARVLVNQGHPPESIHFVGAERGIERTLVPDAGFPITLLPGRGIQRRLTWANVAAVWGLIRAMARAVALVRRERPHVVLAVGGFASAACALAAVLWRVPLVVAEQNARAGAANRLAGRFAVACAVPFPDTDLPRTEITGNPVRPEILDVAHRRDVESARRTLQLPPDADVVVVFAGSLGSRRLNEATYGAVQAWSDAGSGKAAPVRRARPLAVYHVIGARDWDDRPPLARVAPDADADAPVLYRAVRYEDRMDLVLAAADLAVCRSGGTTVSELAVIGVPSVLVPLPIATRDHQTANAGPLVRAGAAVLVPDEELDAVRLAREVDRLLTATDGTGPPALSRMADAARSLGRPDAAEAVARLMERHAR